MEVLSEYDHIIEGLGLGSRKEAKIPDVARVISSLLSGQLSLVQAEGQQALGREKVSLTVTTGEKSGSVELTTSEFADLRRQMAPSLVGVFPPAPNLLIGRTTDLANIRSSLRSSARNAAMVAAVYGWPGVGKSSVAAALAHDPLLHSDYPDGLLWGFVGKDADTYQILSEWARALNVDLKPHLATTGELASAIRNLLVNRRVLIILDDVWDSRESRDLLVGGTNSATVVTTRSLQIASELSSHSGLMIPLRELPESASMQLFKLVAPSVVNRFEADCMGLTKALEGLPLSLHIAGRLLEREFEIGLLNSQAIKRFGEGTSVVRSTVPPDMALPGLSDLPTVEYVIDQSVSGLDKAVYRQFLMLGAFAPRPATFDLRAIKAVWATQYPRSSLKVLLDRGLIEANSARFRLHALLVEFIRHRNRGTH